jgi:hypothetical protein
MRAQINNETADTTFAIESPALPTDKFDDKVLAQLVRVTQENTQEMKLRDESKDASPLSSRCELHFGEQSESTVKLSVKNTFIEAAIEEDDDEPQPLAVWTKTAPGALLPKRFQFEPKQVDVVAAGVVQSLASAKEDTEAAASVSSDTPSSHESQRVDWPDTDEEDMDPSTEQCELLCGEQSERVLKISVKNTFIEAASEGDDDDEPQPLAIRTKTAPGALLSQGFQFEQKHGDILAASGVQSLASTKEDAEAASSVSSDTSSSHGSQRVDWPDTDEEDMGPSREQSEVSLEEKVAMHRGSEAHAIGQCVPCAYFWYKKDGCRLGENCKFCHLCNKGEVKKRKRELIQQLKADGKYRPNFSRRQGK